MRHEALPFQFREHGGGVGQQDGGGGVFGEVMEAKKAMSSEQLAELAAIDPKRAKRYRLLDRGNSSISLVYPCLASVTEYSSMFLPTHPGASRSLGD